MKPFHDFERRVDRLLRELFGGRPEAGQGKEIVEIQRSILDAIDERVQVLPRARRVFPYNGVAVRIPMPDEERRVAFQTVFVSDDALEDEIREHLRRENVEFPADLEVRVSLVVTAEFAEPSIVCSNREAATVRGERPRVRFMLPSGTPVEVDKPRIHTGRYAEVLDDRRRLVRRNDLVIADATVSRAHAHVEYDAGAFRLFDDGSSYGTSVIHGGRLVDVPHAGGRGQLIESGDEIYFGQARVRFEVIQ